MSSIDLVWAGLAACQGAALPLGAIFRCKEGNNRAAPPALEHPSGSKVVRLGLVEKAVVFCKRLGAAGRGARLCEQREALALGAKPRSNSSAVGVAQRCSPQWNSAPSAGAARPTILPKCPDCVNLLLQMARPRGVEQLEVEAR